MTDYIEYDETSWAECERGDDMLYYAATHGIPASTIAAVACDACEALECIDEATGKVMDLARDCAAGGATIAADVTEAAELLSPGVLTHQSDIARLAAALCAGEDVPSCAFSVAEAIVEFMGDVCLGEAALVNHMIVGGGNAALVSGLNDDARLFGQCEARMAIARSVRTHITWRGLTEGLSK